MEWSDCPCEVERSGRERDHYVALAEIDLLDAARAYGANPASTSATSELLAAAAAYANEVADRPPTTAAVLSEAADAILVAERELLDSARVFYASATWSQVAIEALLAAALLYALETGAIPPDLETAHEIASCNERVWTSAWRAKASRSGAPPDGSR